MKSVSNNEQTTRSAPSMIAKRFSLSHHKTKDQSRLASSKRRPGLWKFQIFASIHFESHSDFSKEPGIISLCLTKNISVCEPVNFFYIEFCLFFVLCWISNHCNNWTNVANINITQADIMCSPRRLTLSNAIIAKANTGRSVHMIITANTQTQ